MSKASQDANNSENLKRDDVLKRMLKMRPQPHKSKKLGSYTQRNVSDGKDSSEISDRNVSQSDTSDENQKS